MSLNSLAVFVKMFAGLLSIKMISILLGPTALALLGNFKNTITSARSLATLGIGNGIIKYVANEHERERERVEVLSTSFFLILTMSSVLGLFFSIFSGSISEYLFKTINFKSCVFYFGLLLPLYGFHVFSISVINGYRKFKNLIILSIISSVFALLLTIGLIYFYRINGALLALAIAESLIGVFYLIFFLKKGMVIKDLKWSFVSLKYIKKLSSYSLMSVVTALIFPFTMLCIRNSIIESLGMEQAGFWEAVNRLSTYYLMILTSGISMYYLPRLARIDTDEDFGKEIRIYFKTFVPLCVVLFFVIFCLRTYLIKFVFSEEFLILKDLIIYQLIGDFFKVCSYAFAQQFLAKKLTKPYIVTEVLFYVVYLLLSKLLIVDFGVKGIVYAYLASYIVYFLMMMKYYKKIVKIIIFRKD